MLLCELLVLGTKMQSTEVCERRAALGGARSRAAGRFDAVGRAAEREADSRGRAAGAVVDEKQMSRGARGRERTTRSRRRPLCR